jgi:hypothetical protein
MTKSLDAATPVDPSTWLMLVRSTCNVPCVVRAGFWLSSVVVGCCAAGIASWSTAAEAQDIEGRVKLSLDDYVFLHESTKVTPEGGSSDTSTHSSFGLVPSALGLAAGYALTSSVMIGGKLAFLNDHSESGDSSTTSLLPFMDLSLGKGRAQPTLTVLTGFRTETIEPDQGTKTQSRAFAIGGGAGVRLFASRDFSLDPFAQGIFQTGSGEVGTFSAKFTTLSVLVGFSISGWLGEPRAITPAEPIDPVDDPDRPIAEQPIASGEDDPDIFVAGPAPKVSQDGTIEIHFPLAGGRLRLAGRPADDPASVVLEITMLERRDHFAKCSELALETAEATSSVDEVEQAVAGDGAPVLRGKVKLSALTELGRASNSALVVCDDSFELDTQHRRFVHRFVDVFRAQASRD